MDNQISFTKQIKHEICSNKYVDEQKALAILASYIKINGTLRIRNKTSYIYLKTEDAKIAKFIYELLTDYFSCKVTFSYEKNIHFKQKTTFVINVLNKIDEIINTLHIDFYDNLIDKIFFEDEQKSYGYMTGAFLACGSCASPRSSNYHLELSIADGLLAQQIQALANRIKKIGLNMRLTKRRNQFVVYLKKSDLISSFIIMIGAIDSCIKFEDIRVDRDFLNNDNRLINLDSANYKKMLKSSDEQCSNIIFLKDLIGLDTIDNIKVRELCKIRLENREASMNELSLLLSKRIEEKVSKSNIFHLFKKIEQMVKRYKGYDEDRNF